MSVYEERIYTMLTSSEEKFKSAFEIANHLNMVKRKLIVNFWKSVEKELNILINEYDQDFKLVLTKDIFHINSKCFLYLENNTKAGLIYEHLANEQCMGLWFENPKVDIQKVNSYRFENQNQITNFSTHSWWVSFKNIDENFNNFDSLTMILPENSIHYSKTKAKDLFDFAQENKEHLKYLINNCLK